MSKKVEIEMLDLLDIINCAEDYGFERSILMIFLIRDRGITEEDIEEYCKDFLTEESREKGYTEEDYELSKERLTKLVEQYK